MTNPFTTFDPPLAGPPVLPPTDVSYTLEDTEVGRLLLAVTADGALVTCTYAAARRALAAYLAGTARRIDLRTDLALASAFQREVLTGLAARVGYGERTTYAVLASAVDHPGAARAVGSALGANPLCIVLPCHRVLVASGGVGGYAGGPAAKEHLLALEAAHAA